MKSLDGGNLDKMNYVRMSIGDYIILRNPAKYGRISSNKYIHNILKVLQAAVKEDKINELMYELGLI